MGWVSIWYSYDRDKKEGHVKLRKFRQQCSYCSPPKVNAHYTAYYATFGGGLRDYPVKFTGGSQLGFRVYEECNFTYIQEVYVQSPPIQNG